MTEFNRLTTGDIVLVCDCFRPYISPDGDCGKCGYEIMDRRCEVCENDFPPEEMEERSDGKRVCRGCYLDSLEFI